MEFQGHQKLLTSHTKTEKQAAYEKYLAKELEEYILLLDATRHGMDFTNLDIQTGLRVAAAAQDTLLAQEELVLRSIDHYAVKLQTLQDELEEVRARIVDAQAQLHYMRNFLPC